jgi:mutator protein MutT
MHCQTCSNVFFINAASAVIALIRNERAEFLFTRRKNEPAAGKLDLPGGFVNIGEQAEEAVKREVKEELNLDVRVAKYYTSLSNRYLYGGIVYFTLDLVYICMCEDLSCISANDDVSDFCFISPLRVKMADLGLESVKGIISLIQQNPSLYYF